jgi:hypothetical protein
MYVGMSIEVMTVKMGIYGEYNFDNHG